MKTSSELSTISVTGKGYIEVETDMVEIIMNIEKISSSLKQAQNEVNTIISNVINILKKNGIDKKNIRTTSIKFEPNYTWTKRNGLDYEEELCGQKVSQNLICCVEDIKDDANKVIKILDALSSATKDNPIGLSLSFGIKKNKDMAVRCRELAYKDGFEKAKKFAELAGLKIIKVSYIDERYSYSSIDRGTGEIYKNASPYEDLEAGEYSPTQLPMGGKITTSIELSITFIAK